MSQRISRPYVRRLVLRASAVLALAVSFSGACSSRRHPECGPCCPPDAAPRFVRFRVDNRSKYWRVEAPETSYGIVAQQNGAPPSPLTVRPTAGSDVLPNTRGEFSWCRYLGAEERTPECDHHVVRIFEVRVVLVNVANGQRYEPPPFDPPECANAQAPVTCQLIVTVNEAPDPLAPPLVDVRCTDSCL